MDVLRHPWATMCVCVCVCVCVAHRERERERERESELLPFRSVQKDFSWHLGWGSSSPGYSLACVEEVG